MLREALERAYRRAIVNGEHKASAREKFGALGDSLADTRLHPITVREDTVAAVYAVDPRTVPLADMVAFTTDVSRQVAAVDPAIKHNYVSTLTQLGRELFASTEGALIDQAFALTQGMALVVGVVGDVSQELYDVVGHQRGWEILTGGVTDAPLVQPPFLDFALALARESVELAGAPALPTSEREEVVVTDPHYNTLVSHEIVGHPVELDRALKMETAYAGRSWLLTALDQHQVGQRIASPLVSAYSDPALPGYGHYRYDHEGTPAARVQHIDRGVLTGFMNSRQTAAIFGGEPNGHFKATDAALVPLIRMSNTVFAAGDRDPATSSARSTTAGTWWDTAFRRSPRAARTSASRRARSTRSSTASSGVSIATVGSWPTPGTTSCRSMRSARTSALYPIHNCGKGQPMQTKKLGNGGPTMRSRARLAGG